MAQITKRTTAAGTARYDVRTRIGGRTVTRTFTRRRDADAYASTTEADKLRGVVIDPRRAAVTVEDYCTAWLKGRHDLAVRTAELYAWLLRRYIVPGLGSTSLAALVPAQVRTWHARIADKHPTTAAKAYRLLSSIMRHAVADEVIIRNPCQVKGASGEKSPERPMASIAEVQALADAMPEHLRIAVLLAAWCQLRRAEILGLRRRDVDLLRGTITIATTKVATMKGTIVDKAPKSDAGKRTIAVPGNVPLEAHLLAHVGAHPDSLVVDVSYSALRRAWDKARRAVGRADLHLHDLRHSGLTWSAATGATVAELMHRAGHASPAAALRYQHATEDRDRVLADALAALVPSADVVPLVPRDARAMAGTGQTENRGRNPG